MRKYHIIKETNIFGCIMEDGGDTRKTRVSYLIIPDRKMEEFIDNCANEYGYQDYSHQVNFKEICEISTKELGLLKKAIDKVHKPLEVVQYGRKRF